MIEGVLEPLLCSKSWKKNLLIILKPAHIKKGVLEQIASNLI